MNKSDSWVDNNQGITANGSYIKFNGDATISVTITPGENGYIYYTTASSSSGSHMILGDSDQIITISPATHYYEPVSGGYRVTLKLSKVKLDASYGAKFVNNNIPEVITYTKINLPKRSSVLDFSTSNLTHNSNLVEFGTNLTGSRNRCYGGYEYDDTKCWRTDSTTMNYLFDKMPYSKNDSYFYFFDNYSSSIVKGSGSNATPSASTSSLLASWGLTRVYFDAKENWPAAGIGRATSSSWRYLPLAGFTQPINTVLYNYVCSLDVDVNMDDYVNPINDFNRTALRQLTIDACTKLKAAGVKIYVIKYRAQDNWGALMRNSTTAYDQISVPHNYTEIDNCAMSTGGKMYNISNESDLQSALTEIAEDIKQWSGYEKAKIVTN